ncbi:MAG: very short patch repair endonuclease [Bacteroidota bacterium]|nr:very short patch repair endonuclease [Bacteroidota bacterium]
MIRSYIRDGRAPIPKDERTSALMSRIRGKNTGPEKNLRNSLREAGITGYRLHYKKAPGRPDIAFVGRKIAIFVHGCFWHGCPYCRPARPKSNNSFWDLKLDRNQTRDKQKVKGLRKAGWRVITIRECRLKRSPAVQLRRIQLALKKI